MPAYLQDEDEDEQQLPFYDEDDPENPDNPDNPNAFAVGDPSRPPGGPTAASPLPNAPHLAGVTPEMAAILRSPGRAPGVPAETQQANDARADLAKAKAAVPVPPQPKWWQRVGAGIIGGAAGYANASGHRGVHIDAGPAEQGIMGAGKYQRDLAKYSADVTGAQAKSDAAQAAEGAWWKNRQLNNQEDLQAAQAQQATEHAAYWRHRAEMEQNEWKLDAKTGDMYNTVTGERHPKAATIADQIKDRMAAGYTFEEAKITASGGHLAADKPAPNANEWQLYVNANGGDEKKALAQYRNDKIAIAQQSRAPKPDGPKPPTSNEMRGVEAKKNDRLNVAAQHAQQRIDKGEDRETVFADLDAEKQQIQNQYEGEIQAATGSYPGHFEYPAKPATPAAPAAKTGGRGSGQPAGQPKGQPAGQPQQPPAVKEGTVIRNPKTGERRVLKGGEWAPA